VRFNRVVKPPSGRPWPRSRSSVGLIRVVIYLSPEERKASLLGIIPQGSGLAAAAGRTGLSQLRINGQDVTDGRNVRVALLVEVMYTLRP
jgi:hypothetical protein